MGKDKIALCSIRLSYDLLNSSFLYNEGIEKIKYLISVLKNCVAQNKSNATIKYAFMQYLLF